MVADTGSSRVFSAPDGRLMLPLTNGAASPAAAVVAAASFTSSFIIHKSPFHFLERYAHYNQNSMEAFNAALIF